MFCKAVAAEKRTNHHHFEGQIFYLALTNDVVHFVKALSVRLFALHGFTILLQVQFQRLDVIVESQC